MEIVALVISMLAFVAAGWSAWATHRQARATEEQAEAASAANRTAQEALDLARAADARDRNRQHAEERPNFDVTAMRQRSKPALIDVAIKNEGPLRYEVVTVRPDLNDSETARLLRGVDHRNELAPEAVLGPVQPGETLSAVLVRTDPELGGDAKLIVTASRDNQEWATIHYVKVARPPRIVFA